MFGDFIGKCLMGGGAGLVLVMACMLMCSGGGEGGMEEEEEGVSESTRLLLEKEKYKTRVGERGRAGRRDTKNGGGGREKM